MRGRRKAAAFEGTAGNLSPVIGHEFGEILDSMEIVQTSKEDVMRTYTAVIEKDAETGLLVGYVPGFPGAHSQGADMEEVRQNLEEVVAVLLEDGEPPLEGEFVGTSEIRVA